MKITKFPWYVGTLRICECGCEFEVDLDDVRQRRTVGEDVAATMSLTCPGCGRRHVLTRDVSTEHRDNIVRPEPHNWDHFVTVPPLEAACRKALTAIREHDVYSAAAILRDAITPDIDE